MLNMVYRRAQMAKVFGDVQAQLCAQPSQACDRGLRGLDVETYQAETEGFTVFYHEQLPVRIAQCSHCGIWVLSCSEIGDAGARPARPWN